MVDFGLVLTAMVTPFDPEGQVNYDQAAALAVHLAEHGTDTIVICGTTGESPTLTHAEEYQLFACVRDAVAGKAKVMAGTGSNSTHEAIVATRKAFEAGLDGSLQVVPYYNKPPQDGLYHHFKTIAEHCPEMPLMLYNIPGRTGQNLLPETVAKLADIPNIVSIKEASGNLDQVSQVRRLTPPTFEIYSGDDSLTLPMLAVGAKGVVSVASHCVGHRIQAMVQAFRSGQVNTATQMHLDLLPLFKVLFVTTNPIPVKAALRLMGWEIGVPRSPLTDLSAESTEMLAAVLKDLGLIS